MLYCKSIIGKNNKIQKKNYHSNQSFNAGTNKLGPYIAGVQRGQLPSPGKLIFFSNIVFEFAELLVRNHKKIDLLTEKKSPFNVNSECFVFFKGFKGNSLCRGKNKNFQLETLSVYGRPLPEGCAEFAPTDKKS